MARHAVSAYGLLGITLVAAPVCAQGSRYDISESTRPNYSNTAPWSPGVAESGDTLRAKAEVIRMLGEAEAARLWLLNRERAEAFRRERAERIQETWKARRDLHDANQANVRARREKRHAERPSRAETVKDATRNFAEAFDNRELEWPALLATDEFKNERDFVDELARSRGLSALPNDIDDFIRRFRDKLRAQIEIVSTMEYLAAWRFLKKLEVAMVTARHRQNAAVESP